MITEITKAETTQPKRSTVRFILVGDTRPGLKTAVATAADMGDPDLASRIPRPPRNSPLRRKQK